jgi:hypothetical protein
MMQLLGTLEATLIIFDDIGANKSFIWGRDLIGGCDLPLGENAHGLTRTLLLGAIRIRPILHAIYLPGYLLLLIFF